MIVTLSFLLPVCSPRGVSLSYRASTLCLLLLLCRPPSPTPPPPPPSSLSSSPLPILLYARSERLVEKPGGEGERGRNVCVCVWMAKNETKRNETKTKTNLQSNSPWSTARTPPPAPWAARPIAARASGAGRCARRRGCRRGT